MVQSFFWVCWPALLYTKHHWDWITCFDRDGREIAISTEERSSNTKGKKKSGYIVRTFLKTSTPTIHSVKSEPSKSSWVYVLLSIIQQFYTKMNSQGNRKVRMLKKIQKVFNCDLKKLAISELKICIHTHSALDFSAYCC